LTTLADSRTGTFCSTMNPREKQNPTSLPVSIMILNA
jgi:hypothetical protein